MTHTMMAEFARSEQLVAAIYVLRGEGYVDLEAYSPCPVHGIDAALTAKPSRLPAAVLVVGLTFAALAYALQWLLNGVLYPLNVGSRPPHFPLAFVPITFEMGILFAGLTCFFGVLWLGRLLRLWQPIFEVEAITSVSRDGYWVRVRLVEARDGAREQNAEAREQNATTSRLERLRERLQAAGATRVVDVGNAA